MDNDNRRRQYLIDKKFQLGHTFYVLKIIIILFTVIIIAIGTSAFYNIRNLSGIIEGSSRVVIDTDKVVTEEDNIFEAVLSWVMTPAKIPGKNAIKDVAMKHYENIKTAKGNISTLKDNIILIKKIIKYKYALLIGIVIFVLLQTGFIYFMMIRKTHKISGPIYVISRYIEDILGGKIPTPRALRKKDELKEFYALFTKMVEKIKDEKGA